MNSKELKQDLVDDMYQYFNEVHDKDDCDIKCDEFSNKLQLMLEKNKEEIIIIIEKLRDYYFKEYTDEEVIMFKTILKTKVEIINECIKTIKDN